MIKTILAMALCLSSLGAFAQIIEPGLWEVKMNITQDGKQFNPIEHLQSALKEMDSEQRRQMMQAMEDSGISAAGGPDSVRQCYTKEMIEKSQLSVHDDGECRSENVKRTKNQLVYDYVCKDGSRGKATINIKNKKAYSGHMTMNRPDGEKIDLNYEGRFLSADCGDVKPSQV